MVLFICLICNIDNAHTWTLMMRTQCDAVLQILGGSLAYANAYVTLCMWNCFRYLFAYEILL